MSRVHDVLKFKDGGLSVEDARKKMLEAGETPRGLRGPNAPVASGPVDIVEEVIAAEASDGGLEPDFVDDGGVTPTKNPNAQAQDEELVIQGGKPPAPAPKPAAPVKQPTPATVAAAEEAQQIETDLFVGEIKQEGGQWVARLEYKNGAGTERFVAKSKNELMLELLRGKGHATIRVREAARREKLGGPKLDKSYPLPAGITTEIFNSLPEEAQTEMINNVAAAQAVVFRDQTPDYYVTKGNGEALDAFLKEHDLPYTLNNLVYAHAELKENDLYPDKRVASAPPKILTQETPKPAAEDSVPAAAAPASASPVPAAPAEPQVVVRKRGSTGLQPGPSSVPSGPAVVEDGKKTKELSEAELRKLPLDQLKRISDADRRARATTR